jgi:hypothetical protein
MLVITSAAKGLMLFAVVLLNFIDDERIGNPPAQLNTCLGFLKRNLNPDEDNPLGPLQSLYWGILRNIHPRVLPMTLQVLSFEGLFRDCSICAQSIATFFFLDQATFYGCLRGLHSVLQVPRPSEASTTKLNYYHASFGDFLFFVYSSRGKGLSQVPVDAMEDVRAHCIRWHRIMSRAESKTDITGDVKLINF